MSNKPIRIYWDSCTIISYLSEEAGRVEKLDAIVQDVERSDGRMKIITSAISKVEVAFLIEEKAAGPKAGTEKLLDDFWRDDTVVELVELGDHITTTARDLMRNAPTGKRLKPNDAIHLATARYAQVAEVHTYDPDLLRYDGQLGFPIIEPDPIQGRLF